MSIGQRNEIPRTNCRQIDFDKSFPDSPDGANFCRFKQDVDGRAWFERTDDRKPFSEDLWYVISTLDLSLERLAQEEAQCSEAQGLPKGTEIAGEFKGMLLRARSIAMNQLKETRE